MFTSKDYLVIFESSEQEFVIAELKDGRRKNYLNNDIIDGRDKAEELATQLQNTLTEYLSDEYKENELTKEQQTFIDGLTEDDLRKLKYNLDMKSIKEKYSASN